MAQIVKSINYHPNDFLDKINLRTFTLNEREDRAATTLTLTNNKCESIDGKLFQVTGGNLSIDVSGVVDGISYIYVFEDTVDSSIGDVELNATVPIYTPSKGGYYNGNKKAIYKVSFENSKFISKMRLDYMYGAEVSVTDYISPYSIKTNNGFKVSGSIQVTSTGAGIRSILLELLIWTTEYRVVRGYIKKASGDTLHITHLGRDFYNTLYWVDLYGIENLNTSKTPLATNWSFYESDTDNYMISLTW